MTNKSELHRGKPRTDTKPRTELTPIGEQYVIQGCERKPNPATTAPVQMGLWDQ